MSQKQISPYFVIFYVLRQIVRSSHTTINNKINELCCLKIINKNLEIGGRLPLIDLSRPVLYGRVSKGLETNKFKNLIG